MHSSSSCYCVYTVIINQPVSVWWLLGSQCFMKNVHNLHFCSEFDIFVKTGAVNIDFEIISGIICLLKWYFFIIKKIRIWFTVCNLSGLKKNIKNTPKQQYFCLENEDFSCLISDEEYLNKSWKSSWNVMC